MACQLVYLLLFRISINKVIDDKLIFFTVKVKSEIHSKKSIIRRICTAQ